MEEKQTKESSTLECEYAKRIAAIEYFFHQTFFFLPLFLQF